MKIEKEKKMGGFVWLNCTQFLGAMNDNVFKLLVIFCAVIFVKDTDRATIIAIVSGIFILPFLLFSQAAGTMADKMSKQRVIIASKIMELVVMILGYFAILSANAIALYIVIFLMSTQSAIFGPSKYGIIPELVEDDKLSAANAKLVGFTYLAVIVGTFIPSWLLLHSLNGSFSRLALVCIAISVMGVITSVRIPKTPIKNPEQKFNPLFFKEIFATLYKVRKDEELAAAVFGSAWFTFLVAFVQQNILLYGKDYLHMDWLAGGYLFPFIAFGIGIGAFISSRLSGRNIEFGVVPIGVSLLAFACVVLGFSHPGRICIFALLTIIGIGSGLFIVPLNAFIQYRSPAKQRGRILASTNFISFVGIGISAGFFFLLNNWYGLTARENFLLIGVLTASLALASFIILPDFLIRFCVVLVGRIFYRIKVVGAENIPIEGGAVLVPNHVTYVDALLISATTPRRVCFVMGRDIYENRWMKPIYKLMGVIPIANTDKPRQVMASIKAARETVKSGRLVCIFAEGALTRTGHIRTFRAGFEKIVKGTGCPVIPIYLGGAWKSIFSLRGGRILSYKPRKIPCPINVILGKGMPTNSSAREVEYAVRELGIKAFDTRKSPRRTLSYMAVSKMRHCWHKTAMRQSDGHTVTFGKLLVSAIIITNIIRKNYAENKYIGIALPASIGGALANLAVILSGRVPVNINFTASKESLLSSVHQCEIKVIITARGFIEKMPEFSTDAEYIYLEDIKDSTSVMDKTFSLLKARLLPISVLNHIISSGTKLDADSTATILFSSGSTGKPKGIMLSHHNIISNVEAFGDIVDFKKTDALCGILPFFHSFGFTATLWCPVLLGVPVSYHTNPLDGSTVAKLVREHKLTVMLSTPTFLLAYMRKAKREDFASLRLVITGAEKLKKSIADRFEKRFGVRPMEGYGATELSPVAALNVPGSGKRVPQIGNKEGSIGQPLPGTVMKVVDPDTGEELPRGEDGLLLVKGPNVMKRYFKIPTETEAVIKDGWYYTGDIAHIDNDGFVFIVDRLSRYSKIGGEMVPHIVVEDLLNDALDATERVVAVTSAPDDKRGEQLIIFYLRDMVSAEKLQGIIKESTLPNLWRPKASAYFPLKEMPLLGTGKLDLKRLRELAQDCTKK